MVCTKFPLEWLVTDCLELQASTPDYDLGWTGTLRVSGRSSTIGLQIPLYVSCSSLTTTAIVIRLVFRMTTAFVDFNGVVPEKVCHC